MRIAMTVCLVMVVVGLSMMLVGPPSAWGSEPERCRRWVVERTATTWQMQFDQCDLFVGGISCTRLEKATPDAEVEDVLVEAHFIGDYWAYTHMCGR